jgi:hypothetical protein
MTGITLAVGILNVILGFVYMQYGTMTAIEMTRNRKTMGFSHFGAAWIAMAFTCGPHHFVHGIHLLFEGRNGGVLDLIAVAIGVPAGVIWFMLRVEAFFGGQGDRFISGSPGWVLALPTLFGIYVTALIAGAIEVTATASSFEPVVIANAILVLTYMAIGYFLMRTQLANRRHLGGWSVSGLALAVVFPTCAVMHGIYAYYIYTGHYLFDSHAFWIDWLAVPASIYFLWVVHALYRGTFRDWNGAPGRTRTARDPRPPRRPQAPPAPETSAA